MVNGRKHSKKKRELKTTIKASKVSLPKWKRWDCECDLIREITVADNTVKPDRELLIVQA